MLHLQDISKSFGEKPLFSGVHLRIGPEDRVGLVGRNGSGKTTLFRILAEEISPDDGEVNRARDARIGYLRQEIQSQRDGRLLPEVLGGMPGWHEARQRLADLRRRVSETTEAEAPALLDSLVRQESRFDQLGGDALPAEARAILAGLGFREDQLDIPLGTLSGGWQMRAELARLLVGRPALLLLDEPTNHLDMESLIWFERYLARFTGALVLVAHDREFLNRTVNRIVEVDLGRVKEYTGDYDAYRRKKADEARLAEKHFRDQQVQIRQIEDFIARNRVRKDRAKQVQSRMKMLDRMERLEAPQASAGGIRVRFPQPARSGAEALVIDGLAKDYGDGPVFEGMGFKLFRGEKAALVGVNGAGKSTILKIIAGRSDPTAGRAEPGYNVDVAYFAQHQLDELDPQRTVFEEAMRTGSTGTVSEVRSILGAFRFSGNDADKMVSYLSGGEKSRLALAKLLIRPANLLLMDEPTNHLDIESREVLEEALRQYRGTLLFTSHDRRFIDAVASRTLELEFGVLADYPGNYSYYLWKREECEAASPPHRPAATSPTEGGGVQREAASQPSKRELEKERKRREAELRQALHRELGPSKTRLDELEQSIEEAEAALAELEKVLADPTSYEDGCASRELSRKHGDLIASLNRDMEEWESLSEEYEMKKTRLEADFGRQPLAHDGENE